LTRIDAFQHTKLKGPTAGEPGADRRLGWRTSRSAIIAVGGHQRGAPAFEAGGSRASRRQSAKRRQLSFTAAKRSGGEAKRPSGGPH